ncbi:hypothetical protein [Yinghuangia soli]|uniref:Uncharacterized protein n=1 Tax=Yinghuangia soli TaxID=2908204 RepID=A0AA41TXE5_9ACTN|nr:hypothetical protein [Yinghuangia soli]MCF2526753.1 hypothetical protein [Yinghuangia soli]
MAQPSHARGESRPTQGVLIELPPIIRGRVLVTRGTFEVVVTCPKCGRLHRHRQPGIRRAPCNTTYLVRLGRKRVSA